MPALEKQALSVCKIETTPPKKHAKLGSTALVFPAKKVSSKV